jgi:predicted nucleic acid-binding protein
LFVDAAARLAAESLGFKVTIGVLLRGVRRGYRSSEDILVLLGEIPDRSTLHISRNLLDQVIAR